MQHEVWCAIPVTSERRRGYSWHMLRLLSLLFAGLVLPGSALAQTACTPDALPRAAKAVAASRHVLYETAVAENEPQVPASLATNLAQLKEVLARAAQAAFACAKTNATAEQMEATLAAALQANVPASSETVIETRGKKELGVFGSDLAVQVFPLAETPQYVEVDFRYGVACGDDNLVLVYEGAAASSTAAGSWREVLRWSARDYGTVGDAFGDFMVMTPLSGLAGKRNWRFVVAHGQPGCNGASAPSRFDLDVLEPTADPAQPQVVWHLEHAYNRSEAPRLSTTEDTLTLELSPPEPHGKTAKAPAHPDTFRYRIGEDNRVEPLAAGVDAVASVRR